MTTPSGRGGWRSVVADLRAAGCVFADEEAKLLAAAAGSRGELVEMVRRRCGGAPLEHVLGWTTFCGLQVAVDDGVFVPRRRSEFLAQRAAAAARAALAGSPRRAVVVDLCCGSGAVGWAVAATLAGRCELHAVDIDPVAVRCCERNLAHVADSHVYRGSLYEPLPTRLAGRIDVVVANAPYVPTRAIGLLPREARDGEPRAALDGGADGLEVLRELIAGAGGRLRPGGYLLVEAGVDQAPAVASDMARHRMVAQVLRSRRLQATVVRGRAGGTR